MYSPPHQYRHRTASALIALCCAWALFAPRAAPAQELQWEPLGKGLSAGIWRPGDRCPDTDRFLVLEIDPEQYRFSVHLFAQEGLAHPPLIDEWQKRTGHLAVFNAGLFRENFAYLGLLLKEGQSLGSRRHPTWHGLFVAEPTEGTNPKARILDLTFDTFREDHPGYREAAQSLMLLDKTGTVRVRHTDKRAYQTLVAEGRNGHIFIVKSLSLVTLHGVGECLRTSDMSIKLAMAMDGGSSSDVFLSESAWKGKELVEARGHWKQLFAGHSTAHIPLPAVIGISPREPSSAAMSSAAKP